MRKYCPIVSACLLIIATSLPATSVTIPSVPPEVTCECIGTYTRISFEVAKGVLTNVEVVNSSSNAKCDEWHIRRLIASTEVKHPDGVTGTGVVGVGAARAWPNINDKILSYKQCLITYEIEYDVYWFVEEMSIDLKKINRKSLVPR